MEPYWNLLKITFHIPQIFLYFCLFFKNIYDNYRNKSPKSEKKKFTSWFFQGLYLSWFSPVMGILLLYWLRKKLSYTSFYRIMHSFWYLKTMTRKPYLSILLHCDHRSTIPPLINKNVTTTNVFTLQKKRCAIFFTWPH